MTGDRTRTQVGIQYAAALTNLGALPGKSDLFDQPHFLKDARIIRPARTGRC